MRPFNGRVPKRSFRSAARPDSITCSIARRAGVDARGRHTSTISPIRSIAISPAASGEDHHLGRARRGFSAPPAAWSRAAQLGDGPFFHRQLRHHWIDWRETNLASLRDAFDTER